jgi:hypothetical protein
MTDHPDYVFQCDYCGTFVPVNDAHVYYVPRRPLSDNRELVQMGTYCGRYCGEGDACATVSAG